MHLKLINNKILFQHYKIKCAVGKRGISKKKVEGDKVTPRGTFKIKCLFYRKDREKNIKTLVKKIIIKKNMGWCDDSKSKFYNKLIFFPFSYSAEKLYLKNNIYDMILILDYNMKPIIKNKGSAIFIHIAKRKYNKTEGCIAISKKDMRLLLKNINRKSRITVY